MDEENQMDNPSNEIAAQAHFLDIDSSKSIKYLLFCSSCWDFWVAAPKIFSEIASIKILKSYFSTMLTNFLRLLIS